MTAMKMEHLDRLAKNEGVNVVSYICCFMIHCYIVVCANLKSILIPHFCRFSSLAAW